MKTMKRILIMLSAVALVLTGICLVPTKADKVEAIDVPTRESDVDKGMLDVKAQTTKDGSVIRFVTSVDSLNYHKVGFKITPKGGETITHPIKTVFEKIESTTEGVEYKFSPKVVDSSSEYLATAKMRVNDVTLNYTVQAFVVLLDGETTVYGAERYISANDGLASTPINMSFEVDANTAAVLQNALNNGTQSAVVSASYDEGVATDGVEVIYVDGTTVHARVDLKGDVTKGDLKSATKFIFNLTSDGSKIGTAVHRNYYTSYEDGGADVTWLTAYTYSTTSEFVIATDADLYGFAKLSNEEPYKYTFTDKTVILISDVAIEKTANTTNGYPTKITNTWTPISNNNWFYGTFDGDGNTISGLFKENPVDYEGLLFGKIDTTAVIKDFHLANSYFKNTDGDRNGYRMGLIAGRAYGGASSRLESIYIKEDVVIETDCPKVGGFIGKVEGADGITIANCWFAGTVIQTAKSGITDGLAGAFVGITKQSLNIINCHSTGSVSSDAKGVGGFIGQIWASKPIQITNCLNQTAVTCNNTDYATWCGSVIGWMDAGGISLTIDKVYTTCNVIGTTDSASTWTGIGTMSGAISGACERKTHNQLKGTTAFTDTKLFESGDAWIATTNSPLLRQFADTPSDWYYGKFEGTTMPEAVTYNIETAEEFIVFKDIVSGGDSFAGDTVKLTAGIDLNPGWDATTKTAPTGGLIWPGIGSASTPFSGTFNGNGYTIKGICMGDASADGIGLFNYVKGATITNLKLDNSYYNNNVTGRWWTGSVVGWFNGGTMTKVSASNSVILNCGSIGAGGLVGLTRNAAVQVSGCQFEGEVSTTRRVGGILGEQRANTTISNCYVNATVISTDTGENNAQIGGFVGRVDSGDLTIEHSLVLGEVKAPTYNNLGHVVGDSATTVKVTDVYYANTRINTTGGNINEPNVTYDTNGDVPVEKSISEIQSGNTLFANSSAWVYAQGEIPKLAWLATSN